MPKASEEITTVAKKTTTKRKFDSLEPFVRMVASARHPKLRLNRDTSKLIAIMMKEKAVEFTEGGADLMRWRNKNITTLQSRDVKAYIMSAYPEDLAETMLTGAVKAERKFIRAKKTQPAEES